MAIFVDKFQVEPRSAESRVAHRYLIVTPDQIDRLKYLVHAANPLFKQSQQISVLELLYASFWRYVDKGVLCSSVTIVEGWADNSCSSARSNAANTAIQFAAYTLASNTDYLGSLPLVSIAHKIHCGMAAARDDFPYEGWLIDSLIDRETIHRCPADLGDLVLSSLPLPCLQRVLYEDLGRQKGRVANTGENGCAMCLPKRICCINMGEGLYAGTHDGLAAEASGTSTNEMRLQREWISIDICLPSMEVDNLQLLYAGYDPSLDGLSEASCMYGDVVKQGSDGPYQGGDGLGQYDSDRYGLKQHGLGRYDRNVKDSNKAGLTIGSFLDDEFFAN